MEILAINGSPRTTMSTTRKLVSIVLEGAAVAGAVTDIIELDCRVTPCTACEGCAYNGICVFEDDVPTLVSRMQKADGIIFASPVYIDNVSGQMKVFFDRLADAIHYQVFAGKYGCSLASTHTSGGDEVTAYQNHVLNYMGILSVGGMSVATGGDPGVIDGRREEAMALGRRLCAAIENGYSDPSQQKEIAGNRDFFKDLVIENQDFRPDEYHRWIASGWIR
jgi:multimeric flavodoxin WrbA